MLPKLLKNLRKRVSLESVQENLISPAALQERPAQNYSIGLFWTITS